ncbi:AraC family transcriptional regulator [Lutibacter sp. A64]|uniref:helix-turn-helix domain-containing protein n=1 Tax=Lutibacter sp. A64 TaxID=2918526 RepID=UPI001F05F1AE|nr:AraC family transcriptional regulator [Lutibacter sp. A64]UMB53347.1 AraC family transcriptional regulator [Lutibacter sp. A64]
MKIRFKSSQCNGEEYEKHFNKNVETSSFFEKTHSDFNDKISGVLKEIHINNVYALHQEHTTKKCMVEVEQDYPGFLLLFIIKGKMSFYLNNNSQNIYHLKNNTCYLFHIPPSKYSFEYLNQKNNSLTIYFTESFLKKKMGEEFTKDLKNKIQVTKVNQLCKLQKKDLVHNRNLSNIVNDFTKCSFKGVIRESYLESKLTELLVLALIPETSKITTDKLSKKEKETLIGIGNYIKTNLKKELTIDQLSLLAGINTFKFKSIFKQFYGMTVFKYITTLRIEKAIKLIAKQDYTISQASYEVGYKNPQHFTVAFKKKLGYLPSQIIKNN